ncbi:cyanophycinase [Aliidiomarina sp. Khilg15.8]
MKQIGARWAASILLSLGVTATAQAQAQDSDSDEANWNLFLMGSSPQICSSMNQDACESTDWIVANEMRTARLYNLSDVRRKEAMRRAVWPRERDGIRNELIAALEELADYFGYGVVPEYRLVDRLRSRAHLELIMRLTEAEYTRLLDGLEMTQIEGLEEHVNLDETKDSSADLLRDFVAMAANNGEKDEPRILIVTAAARDPFAEVQPYEKAFEAAGATTQWLPMDATVMKAQLEGKCDSLDSLRRDVSGTYDRARVYPGLHAEQHAFCKSDDAWQAMLAEADAIFFSDGNQNLARDAFFVRDDEPSQLLAGIHDKMKAGELVVGGAGAGAVAMSSGTMVTNPQGTSRQAMQEGAISRPAPTAGCDIDDTCPRGVQKDSLTYHAIGGLGLYPYGVIDTEVSERGRQGRLLRLAADTATPLAIGIDRVTALLLDTRSGEFSVRGDAGVLFIEQPQGNARMAASSFHFLRHNSQGEISRNRVANIELAEQSAYRPESVSTRFMDGTGFYDNIARLCEGSDKLELLQDDFALLVRTTDATEVKRVQGRCQVTHGTIGVAYDPETVR